MTRRGRLRGVAMVAMVAGLAAACAGDGGARRDAAADPCQSLAILALSAERANFTLDFPGAERDFRELAARYEAEPDLARCRRAPSLAQVQAGLGLALSSQRQFALAEGAFERAERAAAALETAAAEGDTGQADAAKLSRAQLLAARAQHQLNRNDAAGAAARTDLALEALDEEGARLDVGAAGELLTVGDAESARRLAAAAALYARSVALSAAGESQGARTAIESGLGLVDGAPGAAGAVRSRLEVQRAIAALGAGDAEAAARIASSAADQLAEEVPGTPLAARARLVAGVALAESGARDAAWDAFELAFLTYEQTPAALRYESVWPYLRLTFEDRAAGRIDEAEAGARSFRAAQLVRSSAAAADIAGAAALFETGEGAAAEAVRDWRAAQERVALLKAALSRRDLSDRPGVEDELRRQLVDADAEERRRRLARDAAAPGYQAALDAPVTLAAVQRALRPGEAMFQVLTGAPRSLVMLIEPDRVRVRHWGVDDALATQLVGYLRRMLETQPDGGYFRFDADAAWRVFVSMFGDLATDALAAERLFVVANGAFQNLPFEALVTADPAPEAARWTLDDYSGLRFFGGETQVAYLPSARNLVDIRAAGGSAATRAVAAFGDYRKGDAAGFASDPTFAARCAPEIDTVGRLPELPGTADEIERIGAAFPDAEIVTREAFTEAAVKARSDSGALEDFRVLHFATHGLLWPTPDCFPPALTTSAGEGEGSDGLLDSGEIRALRLDAQLVVLSACQSAGDAEDGGEGLSGLSRAFLTAGARAVIASHWLVSDAVTADLMADLYGRLADDPDLSFSAALAAAAGALRAAPATSHPGLWAPFVAIGDGGLTYGETS